MVVVVVPGELKALMVGEGGVPNGTRIRDDGALALDNHHTNQYFPWIGKASCVSG